MNEKAKKKALRMLGYGVYILTARKDEEYSASTVTWVSQASFKPPLLMMGIKKETRIHSLLEEKAPFVLHILAGDQKDVAERFFKAARREGNKIGGLEFDPGITGAPVLKSAPAYVECKVVKSVEHGDHTIFLAEIVEAGLRHEVPPLLLRDTPWHYGG